MTNKPPTEQQLDELEARAKDRRAALSGWINCYSPLDGQEVLEDAEAVLEEDVPVLVAEVHRLRAKAREYGELAARRESELIARRSEMEDLQAENAKLIRWHRKDETALAEMRATITRLRDDAARAAAVPAEAGE